MISVLDKKGTKWIKSFFLLLNKLNYILLIFYAFNDIFIYVPQILGIFDPVNGIIMKVNIKHLNGFLL